ncbi:alpha/beta fold hydrolase [Smaragdicoccus niigatensis]|uniref:alpha/beta fold hydrolase n=1 Tax=Smaragdicoccus niigatensis TaxID=359359 RepID=UPI00035E9BD6|nr:alpha/beta hydrolase [Smaragdicoccus niigatensis]
MSSLIPTSLGRLFVTDTGSGPVTVLVHSLFVDQVSWALVVESLAPGRRLILIDAPNHGRSEPADRDFTVEDAARAAAEVLDHLGIAEPVDWVGNALGGHIGIVLAATQPARIRSLVTIGTPVQSLSFRERWTQCVPLVQGYRLLGSHRMLVKPLANALLGSDAMAAQPDQAKATMDAFRNVDRPAMLRAMRCFMLQRPSLDNLLPKITAPTLMIAADRDPTGWVPADAEKAVAGMPNASAVAVKGAGHIAPLLLEPDRIAEILQDFWAHSANRTP